MAFKNTMKTIALATASVVGIALLSGCGGGGGTGGGGGSVIYYPYETVYGSACSTFEPTPGCTFYRDGSRITVEEDTHYNYYGNGSDDMSYVNFWTASDGQVYGDIYNNLGVFQRTSHISSFAGWVGGGYIGVGTTGLFWESVSGGQYYFGKNGVLYSGNAWASNFGEAINNEAASETVDTNFAALSSESNKTLIKKAAKNLMDKYGFASMDKAEAVAGALNRWMVGVSERGHTTTSDMDKAFKGTFGGMDFYSATAAVKDYLKGDEKSINSVKAKVNRSAAAMGLRSDQLLRFGADVFSEPLSSLGYKKEDIETIINRLK